MGKWRQEGVRLFSLGCNEVGFDLVVLLEFGLDVVVDTRYILAMMSISTFLVCVEDESNLL